MSCQNIGCFAVGERTISTVSHAHAAFKCGYIWKRLELMQMTWEIGIFTRMTQNP